MEHNQRIACTVESCKYNDCQCQKCQLENIIVTPMQDCKTKTPEESMCSSYENQQK